MRTFLIVLLSLGLLSVVPLAQQEPALITPTPGQPLRIARAVDGGYANDGSMDPEISADGRYVTFGSCATNLVALSGFPRCLRDEFPNRHPETLVYYYDRATGGLTLDSLSPANQVPDVGAYLYALSHTGRFLVFHTQPALGPTVMGNAIYLRDRDRRTTIVAGRLPDGTRPEATLHAVAISADGRFVSFYAYAPFGTSPSTLLVTADTVAGTSTLDGIRPDGQPAIPNVSTPAPLSADGRFIAFAELGKLYVRDRVDGRTSLAVSSNTNFYELSGSADGRYVSFISGRNVGVYDRVLNRTEVVASARQNLLHQRLSADGRYVSYVADAQGFVVDRLTGARTALGDAYQVSAVAGGAVALTSLRREAGDVRPSHLMDVWLASVQEPPGPSNLSYSLNGAALTLSWSAPASFVPAEYQIHAGTRSGATDIGVVTVPGTQRTFGVIVNVNVPYFISVRARSGGLMGVPSNEIAVLPSGCTALPQPRQLTAATRGSHVDLQWTADPGAGGFQLEVGSRSGASDLLTQRLGAGTTFSADGVPVGSYFVRVRATNACGAGPSSNEVLVQVP